MSLSISPLSLLKYISEKKEKNQSEIIGYLEAISRDMNSLAEAWRTAVSELNNGISFNDTLYFDVGLSASGRTSISGCNE